MGRPHREQWSRTEGEEESYTLVLTQTEEEEAYHGGWTKEKQRERRYTRIDLYTRAEWRNER